MDFRVIPVTESAEWNEVLTKVDHFDCYHTPSYSLLDTSGEPRLLVFEADGQLQAIPFIFRTIPNTDLRDVTSVYGYAGWIRHGREALPDIDRVLTAYFKEEKVVSAFSRIHPLIPGADRFGSGTVVDLNTTLAIDLHSDPQAQWTAYSESVRRAIKRLRRINPTIRLATHDSDVLTFASVYREAMRLLKADPYYFFSDDYFLRLAHAPDYEALFLFAEWEGQILGSALFLVCNEFMQYHLGAVAAPYRSLSPLKWLIDEARLIANDRKLNYLHLGGGLGGQNDDLYVFKSRMAPLKLQFKVWKWIVDAKNYAFLSNGKPESSYFPLYRCDEYKK
ncbi:MAG: GNAT family N-acetyltransferase [Dysgonamonadaceae bacterium]|jgi:hypothetical protein|nr:GNAT family N-acetyltransferase [Dysgonamonadaceae bacterium]